LPEKIESAIFRIAQEALTNVAKHAQATMVTVSIGEDSEGWLAVQVQDDGRGFDPVKIEKQKKRESWGIINMKERALAFGGSVEIDSAPGRGTCVTIYWQRED
jgi:signal transduction histidine kinase